MLECIKCLLDDLFCSELEVQQQKMNFELDLKRKNDLLNDQKDYSGIKRKRTFSFATVLFTFLKENNPEEYHQQKDLVTPQIMGLFDLIPEEIMIKILRLLSIEDLSVLTLVNTNLRNFVIEHFLLNHSGFIHLIRADQQDFQTKNAAQQLQLFNTIGLLVKRSTFLFCTNERINLLMRVLENSYGIPSMSLLNIWEYQSYKNIMKSYGRLINRLITGWGDFECENVFEKLKEICQVDTQIIKFLNSSLGSKQMQELLIRNFFRMICSHSNDSSQNLKEKISWLINTLNNYSVPEIAKLIIVIFGPLVTIHHRFNSQRPYVAWWDLTEYSFTQKGLEDLGLTFHFLFRRGANLIWNRDHVIQILEHAMATPASWSFSNTATLLYHAGYDLTLKFLNKKMKDGKVEEAASYLCYLNIITYKLYQDLSAILKLIDILVEEHGYELIEELIQGFSNILMDLETFEDEDDDDFIEPSEVIESQLELMKLSLLRSSYSEKE